MISPEETRRRRYLEAMGITRWEPRDQIEPELTETTTDVATIPVSSVVVNPDWETLQRTVAGAAFENGIHRFHDHKLTRKRILRIDKASCRLRGFRRQRAEGELKAGII